MNHRHAIACCLVLAPAATCPAQSLMRAAAQEQTQAPEDPAQTLYGMSLYAVPAPEPRQFSANDLVTILVDESTTMTREQEAEFEKEQRFDFEMSDLNALQRFLTLNGPTTGNTFGGNPLLDVVNEFEGEAEYERRDDIRTEVTARVVEVKPNGNLLLEAKTTIQTDDEIQVIALSGYCRSEDVTQLNTVRSTQVFNMVFDVQHEGQMRNTTQKGWITRALESIFNF